MSDFKRRHAPDPDNELLETVRRITVVPSHSQSVSKPRQDHDDQNSTMASTSTKSLINGKSQEVFSSQSKYSTNGDVTPQESDSITLNGESLLNKPFHSIIQTSSNQKVIGRKKTIEDDEEESVISEISSHYKSIIEQMGEDTSRQGLLKTPERAAKAMLFFTKGYKENTAGKEKALIT